MQTVNNQYFDMVFCHPELTKEANEMSNQQSSSGDAVYSAKIGELEARAKTAEEELAEMKEERGGMLTTYNAVQKQQEQNLETHKVDCMERGKVLSVFSLGL